ncbi:hypothetical protein ACWEKT_34640 [Nocardia takedensis]
MPTWLNLCLAAGAGVAAVGLLTAIVVMATRGSENTAEASGLDTDGPRPDPDSASGPASDESAADIWPPSWTHEAPAEPFTADEAHHEMQVHRTCRLDGCARKAAAFRTLIEAGRVTPDSGRMPH